MARIVVLGAGLGGMSAAYALRHELSPAHAVTVIGNGPWFSFTPSNPWLAVGWREPGDTRLDAGRYLSERGIEFIDAAAREIRPDENRIETLRGQHVAYDYLVIATGPEPAFDAIPGLGPAGYTQSVCTAAHAERAWLAYQAFLQHPGAIVIGAAPGASCFGPAYEFAMLLDADLRQRQLRDQVSMTFVTSEPHVGHMGLGGTGDACRLLETELHRRSIRWITNARIVGVEAGTMQIEELDSRGQIALKHALPFAYSMVMPAFTGVSVVRHVQGLTDAQGFVLTDRHQRSMQFPNIFAVGACVAIAPAEITQVPTGAPKTGFMIESMATAAAANLRDALAGRPAQAEATANAVCLIDFGDTGAAIVAVPQVPPPRVTQARVDRSAHVAKLAFEHGFLAKMRAGDGAPIYEKHVLAALHLDRPEPAAATAQVR